MHYFPSLLNQDNKQDQKHIALTWDGNFTSTLSFTLIREAEGTWTM